MGKEFTKDDKELLDELGIQHESEVQREYTPDQERILAGFEDIERFVEEHGRLPEHGEHNDIFERLYAVRLDRILSLPECFELLEPLDQQGILQKAKKNIPQDTQNLTDEELLQSLGVKDTPSPLTDLKHVKPRRERRSPEEVARRRPCENFAKYKVIFDRIQREIRQGDRKTVPFGGHVEVEIGQLFIVDGQKALVVGMDEEFITEYDRKNCRLHVIYDNGTESRALLRSFQRALHEDKNSRRILDSDNEVPELFRDQPEDGDVETGYIYVARSLSEDSFIADKRDLIHKIGMTTRSPEDRIRGASKDPTFLLCAAQLVASYQLSNINPGKMEKLFHTFLNEARLDVNLADRFGQKVKPREWFLVSLETVQTIVELLRRGTLLQYHYDAREAQIIHSESGEVYKVES